MGEVKFMGKAIKINLIKAEGEYDYTKSRLFGSPLVPESWEDRFNEDIIFFGQINLKEIAHLDVNNKLPHSGYLYFFLDTEVYPYTAWVEHYDGEVRMIIDDFNDAEPLFAHLNKAYLMEFEAVEDDYDGNKLFGIPSGQYDEDCDLLLQFDPLDTSTGFLEEIDGYAYFFFGKEKPIDNAYFVIDRS